MPIPADADADTVIMGAGAAGALFAARLAAAGQRVVVLEAGPAWELGDLVSSQIWSRRLKWGGPPVERGGADPIGYNMGVGWGVGGSAVHHYASWPRLFPADFHLASEHGRGRDWPFGYDELRPWYDRVQREAGLSGDASQEPWRPPADPYPLPPLKSFAQGAVLRRGFEAAGLAVAPAPMAVLSAEYDDRPPCQYDGWCDAGCPIQALWNPLVRHIPAATSAGAVIRARSPVTRIAVDDHGRATGLIYRTKGGAERLQPARRIVLAGAAVQNTRLLLASAGPRHPAGFGNRNGEVGRGFAVHALANAFALFDAPTEPHLGLAAPGLMSFSDYRKARRGGPFGSVSWGLAPAMKPNDLLGLALTRADLFGPSLDSFVRRAARSIGVVNAICETIPDPANRIELTADRDEPGMPRARVVHSLPAGARALWQRTNAEGQRYLSLAGAREAWVTPMPTYAHPSGGTVMGTHPATSVTDAYGRVHDAPNVVVAGGGLFPAIGAVSPTFTILALAERAAARMIAHPGEFDG
jgi:choline dehydrogenase-like flavoprotein